jgi:glucose/arabinose dehydrogenase
MLKKLLLIVSFPLFAATAGAQVVQLLPVVTGLTDLVEVTHAGDDRLFCVQRNGLVRIVQNGVLNPVPYLNITNLVQSTGSEQGLLGMAFHPNYAENGFFYLHYTGGSGNGFSRIARFSVTADPNVADPASQEIIFSRQQPYGNHNGGDLKFGPDGYLYFSLGDGGSGGDPLNSGQTLTTALGKILRIDVSDPESPYGIPVENPFATATGDTIREIFATGLRNTWRFGFDALTGDLWLGDVGQNAWEEVDFWPNDENYNSGPNFGWRCYEGFVPYNLSGCGPASNYVAPLVVHATTGSWCSVIGGRVYRGTAFPNLYGRYIYSDYCASVIRSLLPDGEGGWIDEQLAPNQGFGITSFSEDHMNEIYVCNRSNGTLYRLVDPLNVGVASTQQAAITVYPVPANERLVVEGQLERAAELRLYDQTGRLVAGRSLNGNGVRVEMDLTGLSNGVYVLVMASSSGTELARRTVSVVH